jgi:hypothetical protein
MRALSVRQPWAWLITQGIKDVENRSWRTSYRGPLLIHAARRLIPGDVDQVEQQFGLRVPREQLALGAIIGRADLVDIAVGTHPSRFFKGPFGWILANAAPLTPHPWPGRQRFFRAHHPSLDA